MKKILEIIKKIIKIIKNTNYKKSHNVERRKIIIIMAKEKKMNKHFQASREFEPIKIEKFPEEDIIIEETIYDEEVKDDGTIIKKPRKLYTNISKKQRETNTEIKIENLNEVIEKIKENK